ncbi:MAG TPA: thiamine pyrophosphate-dependent dehydrogenase E1 component subunit alpha [Gemmatimonadales bacterium]|nr:thiamine pyrophosphate-dependent dehydrogenase E1 component subunit alpha [Gemmatimonadales bacterium]
MTPRRELGDLAGADQRHEPLVLPDGDRAWLIEALRRMVLIRAVEERIGDEVAAGKVRCPCHLAIGQEAVPVGVARSLRPTDRVFGAHRSHAHYLAGGGSVRKLMAEILGKDTGASRGMGGSMHLTDPEHGLLGTVPIVGATIPIAVGAGLAAKLDGRGDIAVSYFGDGATEEGVFHESLNLAATMRLPVLFVCENNLFSSHLHISLRQPSDSVARYADAHRVPAALVDGNDVVAVARVAAQAIETMRAGGGPAFIEAVTYRWRGHVGPREDEDVGVRRKDDLNLWKGRDPVRRLFEALRSEGAVGSDALRAFEEEARAEAAAAWAQAELDPFPPPEALLDRVYGGRR